MTDRETSNSGLNISPRVILLAAGAAFVLSAGLIAGLVLFSSPKQRTANQIPTLTSVPPTPTSLDSAASLPVPDTSTPSARIDREVVAPPTRTPTPTNTLIPTLTLTPTDLPPPEITWTQAEKYALQWLCYGEVGGMLEVKVDACLSVISTVRARYAYDNAFHYNSVLEAVTAPNQFHVDIYTDRPGPSEDLNWAVEQYQYGMRGSCNGYYFFNSITGALAECTIRSSNGQLMQFHNQPLH